jgi:hypothetical protein
MNRAISPSREDQKDRFERRLPFFSRAHTARGVKSLADVLLAQEPQTMPSKKVIFVAFAIEDEAQRDLLRGQSLNTQSPFDYVDMSVKEAYRAEWKERVRTRIRRSDGVIALISKNSLNSSGQKWEISCAKEENKKVLAIWVYTNDRTNLPGINTVVWSWPAIERFIDGL